MVSERRISRGVVLGGSAIATEAVSGLLLIPVLLHYLDSKLAAAWLLALSFSPLLGVAQAGLGPILTQLTAQASLPQSRHQLRQVIEDAGTAFGIVCVALVVLFTFVFLIYYSVATAGIISIETAAITITLLVAGLCLKAQSIRHFTTLNGLGEVGWDKAAQIAGSLSTLCFTAALLSVDWGIVGAATAYLGGGLVQLAVALHFRRRLVLPLLAPHSKEEQPTSLPQIWRAAGALSVLTLTNLVVVSSDSWIVERLVGLDVLPALIAQTKASMAIIAVAQLYPQMSFPYIAQAWAAKRHDDARRLYWRGIAIALLIAVLSYAVLAVSIASIMDIWIGPGSFLGYNVFAWQAAFGILYINHCAFAVPVFATGRNPFVLPSVINAALALPLAILLGMEWGIPGVLAGNFLATTIPSAWIVMTSYRIFMRPEAP